MKRTLAVVLVAGTMAIVLANALAATGSRKLESRPAAVGPLTPAQRGELARAYVLKWGGYVQRVYKVPVGVWAERMVSTFVHADPDNFRNALKRTTFEGASAELSGMGARVSDDRVIDSMARASLAPTSVRSDGVVKALGSAAADLVYTPVTPCRILDTRVAGGIVTGGTSRDFNAVVGSGGNFSSQGGSATDCGMVASGQAAVVINLTAVTPTIAGYATAYPFGTTQPLASSVNYAADAIVNNSIVVKLPSPLTTKDFSVFTYGTSHFVADIVGYYAPPVATALQCTTVDGTLKILAAGEYALLNTVNCPAGYSAVSAAFTGSQDVAMADSYVSATSVQVFVKNVSTASQQAIPKAICCRVPGR